MAGDRGCRGEEVPAGGELHGEYHDPVHLLHPARLSVPRAAVAVGTDQRMDGEDEMGSCASCRLCATLPQPSQIGRAHV